MEIVACTDQALKKEFLTFRHRLYRGDPNYISTAEFTCEMLLLRQTDFAERVWMCPLLLRDGSRVVAECIPVINPRSPDTLLVAYFEAEDNCPAQVEALKQYVKRMAAARNATRIVYGLNGHLSYGVGFTRRIDAPNSFDSVYTKLYYPQYFTDCTRRESLHAYDAALRDIEPYLGTPRRPGRYTVRCMDMRHFRAEMERLRVICDRTIGTTFLYEQTDKDHFFEIMKDMKPFLKPENVLFACDGDETVGFVFWHPDYNEVLKPGVQHGIPGIALNYYLKKNRIKTVKLNAAGVLAAHRGYATTELLTRMYAYVVGRYTRLETNFVWDNNIPSANLNRQVLKHACRDFEVYIYE